MHHLAGSTQYKKGMSTLQHGPYTPWSYTDQIKLSACEFPSSLDEVTGRESWLPILDWALAPWATKSIKAPILIIVSEDSGHLRERNYISRRETDVCRSLVKFHWSTFCKRRLKWQPCYFGIQQNLSDGQSDWFEPLAQTTRAGG